MPSYKLQVGDKVGWKHEPSTLGIVIELPNAPEESIHTVKIKWDDNGWPEDWQFKVGLILIQNGIDKLDEILL